MAYRWNRFWKEELPHWIARNLPKRVKYWAFIHVCALSGNAPPYAFKEIADYCVKEWDLK